MKRFSTILVFFFAFSSFASAASFTDVPEGHQFYAAIESLKNLGIVNGHPDGTFKPEDGVNNAAALKMIFEGAGIEVNAVTESGFADVPTDAWFAKYTKLGKERGIVKGSGETGNFDGAKQVNKVEFLKMMLEAFEKDLSNHMNLTEPIAKDIAVGDWTVPYMSYAKILGIISPDINGNLLPAEPLSRGQCAEILYKLLVVEQGGDAQKYLNIAESKLVDVLVTLKEDNIKNALQNANDAVFYTEQAMKAAPDQNITKAANKIALGFQNLCFAYNAGLAKDFDSLKSYVDTAKKLAGDAYADDPSTQSLGKKIKEQGDILLEQIETE